MHVLTLVDLLTEARFRKMNLHELEYTIDYELRYCDYCLINGTWSAGKAVTINKFFQSTCVTKLIDPVSLVDILTKPEYRKKTSFELAEIVNFNISYEEFSVIAGENAREKGDILFSVFNM